MHGLAVALGVALDIAHCERIVAQVQRWSSDLIELSTDHSFTHSLAIGEAFRGWALSASGNTAEGLSWLKDGIEDYRVSGSIVWLPYLLELKAEASYLADRTSDALQAIMEVEELVERFLADAGPLSNCTDSEAYFSRPSALTRPKLRLHFAKH